MEQLKKARIPLRASVTRTVNEAEAEIAKDEPDFAELRLKLRKLTDVMAKVADLDQKILTAMLDEDATEEEYGAESITIEEYEDKVRLSKLRIEDIITPTTRPPSPTPSDSYYTTSESGGHHKKSFKLPKIELKKFNGELTEWIGWWSQFEKIHEDEDLHATDKFQYLIQATVEETRARKLVESYPQSAANYPKVIEALKDRFGDKVLLAEVYVRKLLQFVNKQDTKTPLSTTYDELESHLRALESLGVTSEHSAIFLYPMIESSLPVEIIKVWQRSSMSGYDEEEEKSPEERLNSLMKFMKKEVKGAERLSYVKSGAECNTRVRVRNSTSDGKSNSREEQVPTAAGLFTGQVSCIFCNKSHLSQECGSALNMKIQAKNEKIKEKRACFYCLRSGHLSKNCKAFVKCPICTKKHYALMCPDITANKSKSEPSQTSSSETKTVAATLNCTRGVLLKTLLVRVVGGGITHTARLVFDDGSQRTYIKKSTAALLKYQPIGSESMRQSLFGGVLTQIKNHKKYKIKVQSLDGKSSRELIAREEDELCGSLSRIPKGPWIQQLARKKIWLSDFNSDNPDIEILVGSDYWGSLMTGKKINLNGGLTAWESVFGWTICGSVQGETGDSMAMSVTTAMYCDAASAEELWSLETLGIRDPTDSYSKEEKDNMAKEHFLKTVSRKEDGRYSVSLPWIDGKKEIPSNRMIAERRLDLATTKLTSAGKYNDYDNILKSWLEEGIIEEVHVNSHAHDRGHYLPHRAVFKPESLTTPIRPVFDASCKSGRSPSLNDCLEKGPNLMELLPALLLRFREKRIGVLSDIRKAFLMVEIKEEDRDYLRFLWWEDPVKKIYRIFRHARVLFGITCGPFLLAAVIEHHLSQVREDHKPIADKLSKSLYVDNCVTSVDTIEEYETFKKISTKLLADAKMELRQWEFSSGRGSGIGSHPECGLVLDRETTPHRPVTSVLGLKWYKEDDTIGCDFNNFKLPEKITKRNILSVVQKIFDPIGFLCPVLLLPKMQLQETWSKKTMWDEDLTKMEELEQICNNFVAWTEQLSLLEEIRIPRCIRSPVQVNPVTTQLHIFCDASKSAFATVIFLRTTYEDECVVQLLQAKSRVAPIKKVTIPRLELLSCVIGVRLAKLVKEALYIEDINSFFWGDSTTALAWIKRNNDWGTFVGNRVRQICSLSKPEEWRHVPGVKNPADLPSRGCSVKDLLESRWWEGPTWLKKSPEDWPVSAEKENEEEISCELRKAATKAMLSTAVVDWFVPKFSSYSKNLKVMTWVLRFIHNVKVKKEERHCHHYVTLQEMRAAEVELLKIMQAEGFPNGLDKSFGIKIEKAGNGLIHVKSNLTYRKDTEGFKYPVLLPSNHALVEQLILEAHKSNNHAGVQFLLGHLREKYWITQGRRTIKKTLSKCAKCRRFDSKPLQVEGAPLPAKRVTSGATFETTGVDLAGPLFIYEKGKSGKVWIVLYTCAVYRCVFLDLVTSLSTEAFIGSLERFISQHGRPSTIFSDNGTNFVGAVNLFKKLDWSKIEKTSQSKQIQWIFNPPTAAWWGGWWERLVRSVKDLLRRKLDKSKLSHEELRTCLAAVGATINDRPLTTVTEDLEDLRPLTPGMFLHGMRNTSFPEGEKIKSRELQNRYKKMQQLREELQARFRKEYLSQLVQKKKEKKTTDPKVGDIVFVGADNKKRFEWPLGRIIQLIPGRDKEIRVAKVKTATGILTRPLQRLYPVEVPHVGDIPAVSSSIKEIIEDHEEKQQVRQDVNNCEEQVQIKTKSGRLVRKPCRYGKWSA